MFRKVLLRAYCQDSKAKVKISWNWDNKELYGSVIKQKRNKKSNPELIPSENYSLRERDKSSEIHWVFGSTPNKNRIFPKKASISIEEGHINNQPAASPAEKSNFEGILKIPLSSCSSSMKLPELLDYNEAPPSVGKVLQATMSDGARRALEQWKLSKIEELGVDGFAALQKENLNRGLRFHGILQDYFTGEDISPDKEDLVWRSVQSILPEIDRKALFVEKRVKHPILHYKGVVDCVSSIRSVNLMLLFPQALM